MNSAYGMGYMPPAGTDGAGGIGGLKCTAVHKIVFVQVQYAALGAGEWANKSQHLMVAKV